jgi:hypothetical protein
MNELMNERTETVRRYDVRTTCDRCGAEIPPRAGFEVDETTIVNESGVVYPECYDTQFEGVDCCEECWDLVRAALVSLGFKVRAWRSDRDSVANYIEVG